MEIILIPFIIYLVLILFLNLKGGEENLSDSYGLNEVLNYSIIIPFRNEANNLSPLIKSLRRIDYLGTMEIIFIDDHSEDNSIQLINELFNNSSINYRVIRLDGEEGKKNAIRKGVEESKFDFIVLTDADCEVPENWLESLNKSYLQQNADFIIGAVVIKANGFFERLQSIEFSAIMGLTEVSTLAKRPIMCNGANLSYRKDLFNYRSMQKDKSHSGDDLFLMHAIKKQEDKKIVFNSDSVVKTRASVSLKEFISQRLRWASKSIYIKDTDTLLYGFITLLLNIGICLLFVIVIFNKNHLVLLAYALLFKFLADVQLVIRGNRFTDVKSYFLMSLIISIAYPIYSLLIASFSLFLNLRWKGRKI